MVQYCTPYEIDVHSKKQATADVSKRSTVNLTPWSIHDLKTVIFRSPGSSENNTGHHTRGGVHTLVYTHMGINHTIIRI